MHMMSNDGGTHGYHLRNTRAEIVAGANLLRGIMRPVVPMLLISSRSERTILEDQGVAGLWDMHLELQMDPRIAAIHRRWAQESGCTTMRNCPNFAVAWQSVSFWKTSALLQTPFERTLFLDNDVYVLQPSLAHVLLSQTLRACDIAMPLNVDRGGAWQRAPVPQPCNAMIVYQRTSDVLGLFVGALQRIVAGTHRQAGVQQRDQDMIYFEWFEARPQLRFLMLPEEYYCPDQGIAGIDPYSPPALWKKMLDRANTTITCG